jgi:hypothetical protein
MSPGPELSTGARYRRSWIDNRLVKYGCISSAFLGAQSFPTRVLFLGRPLGRPATVRRRKFVGVEVQSPALFCIHRTC